MHLGAVNVDMIWPVDVGRVDVGGVGAALHGLGMGEGFGDYLGKEAVEQYFSNSPDIVLMDIMMPSMSGYEAFDQIMQKASGTTAPIIALTAKVMKDDRDELLAHGFSDYIPKPIDDEALIRAIEKHLQPK